ncbi:hypothetical protein [Vibrio barjaei]|uniref:hypothetical protein n=1 Tax=Vibrio barjaei TaxID=1676683 RepID=UPI0022842E9C|nr:hypothetical protein [Vibrio barjaei]MCY9874617.1 hypothetical protein [Vibrio barjaei]
MSKITYLIIQRDFLTNTLLHLYIERAKQPLSPRQVNQLIGKDAKSALKHSKNKIISSELKAILHKSKTTSNLELYLDEILTNNTKTLGAINDFQHFTILTETLNRLHDISSGFLTGDNRLSERSVLTDQQLYLKSYDANHNQITPVPLFCIKGSIAEEKLREALNDNEFLDTAYDSQKGYTIAHVIRNQYLRSKP